MNPELFLQLDRVIHEKGRLAILSALAATPELSFTELRETLGMTDGNLSTHVRILQEEGFISVAKSYEKNRPPHHLRTHRHRAQSLRRLHRPARADRPAIQTKMKFFEQQSRGMVFYFVTQS